MKKNRLLNSNVENNILDSLSDRIRLIEKAYNPEGLNLHFDNPPPIDIALFEELLPIGQEAWNIIQNHISWETYYWFYKYFELIARASLNVLNNKSKHSISTEVIKKLVVLLVDITQMTSITNIMGADITKRHHEALGNMLIIFDRRGELKKLALKRGNEINIPDVIEFTKYIINFVEKYKKKRHT